MAKKDEDLVREVQADGSTVLRRPKLEKEARLRVLEKLRHESPEALRKSIDEQMEVEEELRRKSKTPYIHTDNMEKLQEIKKMKEKEGKEPELTSSMIERFRAKSEPKKGWLDRLKGK